MPEPPVNPLPNYPFYESPLFERILPQLNWGPDFVAVARGLRENGFTVIDFPVENFATLADGIIERLGPQFGDSSSISAGAMLAGTLSLIRRTDGTGPVSRFVRITCAVRPV